MKKILKFLGKGIKLYLIVDILGLAIIGAGEILSSYKLEVQLNEFRDHPTSSILDLINESNGIVWRRTGKRFKSYLEWMGFKRR